MRTYSRAVLLQLLLFLSLAPLQPTWGDCISSNATLNAAFVGDGEGKTIPQVGSCCMKDVCGLECPVPVRPPAPGHGYAVIAEIILSAMVGVSTYFFVNGDAINYFVAARSLPLWMVTISLAVQSLDYSSLMGNADLSYRYSFFDGAVIPIGLSLSLFLNAMFLAGHVQRDGVLTLVDVYAKRYGRAVEVLASMATVTCFLVLLAGNLRAVGILTGYLWGVSESQGVWVIAFVVWAYTECGGLYSVVYTGIFQAMIGWMGLLVMAYWFIANDQNAPPPSIGYPGYIYPDNFTEGGACDLYNGTKCEFTRDSCCYNTALWCPGYPDSPCERYDRGAYPVGDKPIYGNQMSSPTALDPFPNALLWNWATIIILGVGNVAALDFQARCIASNSARTARIGCLMAACITVFIGIPFSYLGSIIRLHYGPDSVHSTFEVDSCSEHLNLPTCGQWVPDPLALIKLLTNQAPGILGAWCLVGIVSATMSTASGAILAMATVVSNNLVRQFDMYIPGLVTHDNLEIVARVSTLPVTIASACIAAYYKSARSINGGTGYLLIVAFDIVLATVVVPLFGCFYARKPSPRAALVAILGGAITRIVLEFTIPKDGSLIMPYDSPAFMDFGTAASANPPSFIDTNQTIWDPKEETCHQVPYKDYTGADSLSSLLVCLILFLSIQFAEHRLGRPLFYFPGGEGYDKNTNEHLLLGMESETVSRLLQTLLEDSEEEDDDDYHAQKVLQLLSRRNGGSQSEEDDDDDHHAQKVLQLLSRQNGGNLTEVQHKSD